MSRSQSDRSETRPLLDGLSPETVSTESTANESIFDGNPLKSHAVEDDVLPETAVAGRTIGWSSAYIIIVSRVIGSGIFATPGAILRSVGSPGLSLVLWVAGAVLSWFGLMVTLEYGCMLPRSGGDKVYLEFTYRRPRFLASVLIAVQSVLLGFTASNCIVFAEYAQFAVDEASDSFATKLIAAGLLTVIVIIHGCFLRAGIAIQNMLGWVKIGLIISMILMASYALIFTAQHETGTQVSHDGAQWLWAGSNWNWGIMSTALFKVFYSYAGLHNVNNVLSEVKDPVRTLKSAATIALWTCCILYVLINLTYFTVIPLDEIKTSGELVAALLFKRILDSSLGRVVLSLAIAISAAGNVMVVTFSHARMIQEIARRGILPFQRWLASSQPFNAPLGALVTHYIPSLLVITIPTGNVYSFILDVEGYPAQFYAIATSFGLILLRLQRPDLRRTYKAFLPAVWLRILLSLALLAAPFVPEHGVDLREHLSQVAYAFVGTSIILFGVLYWYIWTVLLPRWRGYSLEESEEALDDGTIITKVVHTPYARRSWMAE